MINIAYAQKIIIVDIKKGFGGVMPYKKIYRAYT